jgi:hypothetical protein
MISWMTPVNEGQAACEDSGSQPSSQQQNPSREEYACIVHKSVCGDVTEYHVYAEANDLDLSFREKDIRRLNALTDLCIFLDSLTEQDVVRFFMSGGRQCQIESTVKILSTIQVCKARTVFMIDTYIDNGIYALACKEIESTSLGILTMVSTLSKDTEYLEAYKPYIQDLFTRAKKINLLTDDEVDTILNKNGIIMLDAKHIQTRLYAVS